MRTTVKVQNEIEQAGGDVELVTEQDGTPAVEGKMNGKDVYFSHYHEGGEYHELWMVDFEMANEEDVYD